ncbi:MAG: pirin-like C-terminal cupin domain-containing protein [Archangium sp.]
MKTERRLRLVEPLPPVEPGFLGPGHTAIEVLRGHSLVDVDPFVLLMDDRIDIGPTPKQMGGAHPHAGLETVTLVLEGTVDDRDEGKLSAGDALWMTAGRGVIHSENIEMAGKVRVLQLWIRLPAKARGVAPSFEKIALTSMPIHREPGVEVRLYSGATHGLRSATLNEAAITMAEVRLEPGAKTSLDVPRAYNGFLYVLDGAVGVGGDEVRAGHLGWIDRAGSGSDLTSLTLEGGPSGGRVVAYLGQPQNEPLVHHGPFVAGDVMEIQSAFRRFRAGEFAPLSTLSPRQI